MELRQLRYFLSLAEELHFGRAAERESIGQPALSLQIARLEAELDIRLFDRTSRRVRLTEVGSLLLDDARLAIRHTESVVRTAQLAACGRRGRLQIGYADATELSDALDLVQSFRETHPEAAIYTRMDYESSIHEVVAADELDAGVVWLGAPAGDGLATMVLFHEAIVVAVGSSHPLADRRVLNAAEILEQPLVLPPKLLAPSLWTLVLERLAPAAGRDNVEIAEEASKAAVLRLVARSEALSLVPACVVGWLGSDAVRFVRCKEPALGLDLGLIWRPARASPLLKAFLSHCRSRSEPPAVAMPNGRRPAGPGGAYRSMV